MEMMLLIQMAKVVDWLEGTAIADPYLVTTKFHSDGRDIA